MTRLDSARRPRWYDMNRVWVWTVALAVLPVVIATTRAVLDGWLPIGDNAFFAIRARDVFGSHIPLLGTWTSASLTFGHNINNPGALLFDVYALPTLVFGSRVGIAIAAAGLNIGAILGIAWAAYRRGGGLLVASAMAVTTILGWSMGSELLFDPWQPHSLVLPFLLYLFLTWSLACGDLPALPWTVGVASLLVQTHLTYTYLVPALGLWGLVGLGVTLRSRRGVGTGSASTRRRVLLTASVAAAVGALCWLQPLVEQVSRDNNLSRLTESARVSPGAVVGTTHSVQVIAKVLSLPPFFLRPSFESAFEPAAAGPDGGPAGLGLASLPSLSIATASLGVWVAVIAGAGWLARRSGDHTSARAAVTALVGLGAGIITAARIPTEVFGVAAHQFRWLWPLAAFATFTALAALLSTLTRRDTERSRIAVLGLASAVGLFAALTLPAYNPQAGPGESTWAIAVMRDIDRQLASIEGDGPFLYDFRDVAFAEPYSTPIMAELQRRDIEFFVNNRGLIRQLGPARQFSGHNADERIFYRLGDAAMETRAGERRVAFHPGLDRTERLERDRLDEEVQNFIADGNVRLNAKGRRLLAAGELPSLGGTAPGTDLEHLARPADLVMLADLDTLSIDQRWTTRLERFRELSERFQRETIGVFVAPIDPATRDAVAGDGRGDTGRGA